MKFEDIEIGMEVVIGLDLTITDNHYGVSPSMREMRGQIHKVKNKRTTMGRDPLVVIGRFNWHPFDLRPTNAPDKESQHFHFDTEGLDI